MEPITTDADVLLTSDVAAEIGCTPDYVRVLERSGRIHAQKTASGVRLFSRAEVARVKAERTERLEARARGRVV